MRVRQRADRRLFRDNGADSCDKIGCISVDGLDEQSIVCFAGRLSCSDDLSNRCAQIVDTNKFVLRRWQKVRVSRNVPKTI